MDSIEITVRLTYAEPLSHVEYEELLARFCLMVEREVAPGGELAVEESDVIEFENESHHGAGDR